MQYTKISEVMNWKSKDSAVVFYYIFGSSAGYSVWKDFQPTYRHRTVYRIFISDYGISGSGRIFFSKEHICSGDSFISIVSNACPWGRRYQIIFRDRQYTYNSGIIQMYGIWVFDRWHDGRSFLAAGWTEETEIFVCVPVSLAFVENRRNFCI